MEAPLSTIFLCRFLYIARERQGNLSNKPLKREQSLSKRKPYKKKGSFCYLQNVYKNFNIILSISIISILMLSINIIQIALIQNFCVPLRKTWKFLIPEILISG